MNKLLQKILFGFNNQQVINILSAGRSVDIMPQDLDSLLSYFSDSVAQGNGNLIPIVPDLDVKNELNGVNLEQFDLMRDDIIAFQDIEDALRHDKDGSLKKKYKIAIKLLNTEYMAKFQGHFPEFVVKAAKTHRSRTNCSDIISIQFIGLLHYMYSVCDIGVKP